MSKSVQHCDVLVIGAGNAALSAALSASEAGAKVTIIEKAPRSMRGGNSRFTALYRFAYDGLNALRALSSAIDDALAARMDAPPYSADAYYADLMASSRGKADCSLMRILADESYEAAQWLTSKGVEWVPSLEGAKEVGGKLTWQPGIVIYPKGGGLAVLNRLFDLLECSGSTIAYDTELVALCPSGDHQGWQAHVRSGPERDASILTAASVILAAGGFEADLEMRARYLGPGWDLVKVRGSRFNTGECLRFAIELGAATDGHWSGCHATMVHAGGAEVEMGDAAFPHAYPLSIMVNVDGRRFADEGEDFQYYTYAKLGRAVLVQPHGRAFQVFDGKTIGLRSGDWLGTAAYELPCGRSNALDEAAQQAGIMNISEFRRTVAEYNVAVQDGAFDPSRKDGKHTLGLDIDKSNWALRIDQPPFEVVPVECGITFTFGGLKFNGIGQVLDRRGSIIKGLYVVGEMAGTFFLNYAGGSGLTKGTVFGRRAGRHAALRLMDET